MTCILQYQGARDGAVMRAFVSVAQDQIPALTPYVSWVCCWLSPLFWEVFLRVLRFSPLLKDQHFQFQFDQGSGRLRGCAPSKSLFIYYSFISCTWCYLLLYFRKLYRCFVKLPIFWVSLWALYISIEPCCPTTKS